MKAKSLSPAANVYTTVRIASATSPYGIPATVLVRTIHNGEAFEVTEAYMAVEKAIPEGSIADNLSFFNEVIGEWYNAYIDTDGRTTTAQGYAPLMKNWRYTAELANVRAEVAKWTTKASRKSA